MIDIVAKVATALSGIGTPAQWLIRPETLPSISFDTVENLAMFGDGEEKAVEYSVQIDIWSENDPRTIGTAVKTVMKSAGFTRTDDADLYEEETRLYHKAIRFKYPA